MDKKAKRKTIKDLAEEDRPREKLLLRGVNALSDAELLAIILGSGNRDESAIEVASKILKNADYNLNTLGHLSIKELITTRGVGPAKAINIVAALELGLRRKVSGSLQKRKITGSRDAFEYLHPIIGHLDHEESFVILLDNASQILSYFRAGQGGITGTVMDPRVILKNVIMANATRFIIAHNHPSGNLTPSDADISITRKLREGAQLIDLQLLDHIIVSDKGYYSFADEGQL
ncbi:MAG: hypothetical protein CVU05_07030 [Bacteroidetes bacterium HGW-Bacteroidetes-21]|nr:MAG: hypothetical protein CVU05_07030 [Bacteroidetes bacterium HGW-Bacteroidetes-21]